MKYILKLKNGKKRKRYLVSLKTPTGTIQWASVLHCSESLNISVQKIYKAIKDFTDKGLASNLKPLIRKHFLIEGYNLLITIQNQSNENIKQSIDCIESI